MESHVKFLGLMHILVGGFGGLGSIIFFGLFAGPTTASAYGPLIGYTVTGWMALLLILMLPTIALGVGLLNYRPWARSIGTVIAIIELLNFPLGTVLGVYALWVLMSPETDPLFSPRFQ
ncbi:MAG TPA: hypothetical protein VK776_27740 [Bryobacteraceae bacterium]|nr:hypothetical protein [Bryobacteraceae bacterium]